MASYTAEIQLMLDGGDAVKAALQELEEQLQDVGKRQEIRLMADKAKSEVIALSSEVKKLKRELDSMSKEDVGWEGKNQELKEAKKNAEIATTANRVLSKTITKLNEVEREEAEQHKKTADALKAETKEKERAAAAAQKQAAAEQKAADKAAASAEKARIAEEKRQAVEAERWRKAHSFSRYYNDASSKIAHLGSAMQSAGNAISQLTSPFKQITDGMLMGAGYKLLGKFTEGLDNGFNRYDIMKKYPRIMAAFNISNTEAEESIKALDKSVRGLPTGLDEMVDLAQRFTATTGNLTKGTKLAIATNNAFLASMSTDTQRYQGMMQLQDVLGGKDMNAREWNSLVSSMTPAIVKMGEAMKSSGKWSKSIGDFIQHVRDGKMDNQKFIDQLIEIGNEGGVLEAMAQESKNTWQAFFANVGNAASRMTAGVIESLDEIVKTFNLVDKNGVAIDSVNMLLANKLTPAIDGMTTSIKDWIHAHPEEIVEFFKTFGEINWKQVLSGFAEGALLYASAIEKIAGLLSGDTLSKWFGRSMSLGNLVGKILTIGGGLLKGSRIPLAAVIATVMKAFGGKGIFDKLKGLFGKKKAIEEAGDVAKSIPKVSDTFKSAFKSLEGLMKMAGAVTLVSGTGFVAFKAAKSILSDLRDMSEMLNEGDWSNAPIVATGVIGGIGAAIEIFNYIGKTLGAQGLLTTAIASAATVLVSGTFAADMWLIKQGVVQIRDTITALDEVANEIQSMQGIGTLDDGVKEKFRTTIEAINEIKNMFVGKSGSKMDRGQVEAGLPTFGVGKVTALTNLTNAIHQMQSIVAEFNALSSLTVNDPTAIITEIKTACNSLQGLKVSRGLPKQATAISTALVDVRHIASSINALAGQSVNAGGFADTIAQIKAALEAIKGMNQTVTLDIKVVMGSGFRSSVDGVVRQLKDAKKKIEDFKKPIAFIIPVNVTFSVVTNAGAAIAKLKAERERVNNARNNIMTPMYSSTGGRISRNGVLYRSGGGGTSGSFPSVASFRPKGTDKIPAMLTEGEYVQKKQAVDFFGLDFMRKINNMDVRGAMNALLTKAGTSVGVGRQSIVNNTVNNNQRITQNINTNNPNFAGVRIGRFVGAL